MGTTSDAFYFPHEDEDVLLNDGKEDGCFCKKAGTIDEIQDTLDEDTDHTVIKGPQDIHPHLLISSAPSLVKVLLVFNEDDKQMDILATASARLGWSLSVAKDAEDAVETFQKRGHELVIIDRRGHLASQGDSTCRAIRSSSAYHNSVIIALVKKSYYTQHGEKDDIVVLELLEKGYSRTLIECLHEDIVINQLIEIYTSSVLPKTQVAAAHTLYLALDRCRDMVHITNEKNIVQYLNKVTEKLLGYKTEELIGKSLNQIVTYENSALMEQQLSRGREFEGNMNCKRKNNQMIVINCRIIPFCITPQNPTHFVYIYDTSYLLENAGTTPISPITCPLQQPLRLSMLPLPRKSSDVKSTISEGRRRSSLQKLNSLQLEAPITKVITLLSNAIRDTDNEDTANQINVAIDILKKTELYVPYLKEDVVYTDPVATDLVGALLSSSVSTWESRRSSADSARISSARLITGSHTAPRLHLKNLKGSEEILMILDKQLEWEFEIFKLEVTTAYRPLYFLGMSLMNLFNVPETLNCDEKTIQNWLTLVESKYRQDNSYHNSTHAADVLQATARFMQSKRLQDILEPLDEAAMLIAAATHDIDHPGRTSQFLCNSNNKLAILYNDLSVLESHHAAFTFKLTLTDDNVNIFKYVDNDTYKRLRQNVIDLILATDMTEHFKHLAKFMNVCDARIGDGQFESCSSSLDLSMLLLPENVMIIKRMMIKCADVSNPIRPLRFCVEWAKRITEEYFSQTDEEKKLKMPVVMPMFDRMSCSIAKSQIGFFDFIINDMFETWESFIDMPEILEHMRSNYEKWREFNEQGISTLQDIKNVQQQPELYIL